MGSENRGSKSKITHLRREISLLGSFSMGFADVGADVFVAIGLVAAYAAGFSPLAFLIASICYVTTGLVYSELTVIYPYAGGAQIYGMRAKGDALGFLAGWAIMLDYVLDIGLFSIASAGYLSFLFPILQRNIIFFPHTCLEIAFSGIGLTAFLITLTLIGINVLGIKESSFLNQVLVVLTLIVEALVLISGFLFVFKTSSFLKNFVVFGSPVKHREVFYVGFGNVKNENIIYSVTLAMSSFIGIESIAQAAEETKKPAKFLPEAFKLSIIAVILFTLSFSVLGLGTLGWKGLSEAVYNPVAKISSMVPGVGTYLSKFVALVAFAICVVSTNTGVIGVSRVIYSMSRYNLFPLWFSKLHEVRATPVRSIVIFGLLGGLLALLGRIGFVASLYNYGAVLSYVLVNFSHIVLRGVDKDAYRPWKTPLNFKFRGKEVSLVSALGLVSTSAMFSLILLFHPTGRVLGTVWMATGFLVYVVLRKRIKLPVFGRVSAEKIKPALPVIKTGIYVPFYMPSEKVVVTVEQNLRKLNEIYLLTVLTPEELKVRRYSEIEKLSEETGKSLREACKKLRRRGYRCEAQVVIGERNREVINFSEKTGLDEMVFVGIRKRRGIIKPEKYDEIRRKVRVRFFKEII